MPDLEALRAAYARRDPNADELRRSLAHSLRGAAYLELVCVVAEQAWRCGEQCRAEALLRHAALLGDTMARDASPLARRIAGSVRLDPEVAHAVAATAPILELELECALMRFDPETLDHVPAMALDDRWLLVSSIASGRRGSLAERCALVVDAILAHHNRGLAAPASYDPHFIGVSVVAARIVGHADVPALAASLRRSSWTPSPLYAADGLRFAPLTVSQVIAIVGN